jgi:hypothetical protein
MGVGWDQDEDEDDDGNRGRRWLGKTHTIKDGWQLI